MSPDRHRRIRRHRRRDPDEPLRRTRSTVSASNRSVAYVNVTRRCPPASHRVVALGHDQLQVELAPCPSTSSPLDREPGQLEGRRRRCSGTRAPPGTAGACDVERAGFEHLDQPLERHVRVRERRQVGLADAPSSSANARAGPPSVRRTRVLTNMPTRSSSAASPRPAIGVPTAMSVRARQPRQQHRERGVHDHEQRRTVRAARARRSARVQSGVDRERDRAPRKDCTAGRGRSVGSSSCVRQPRQRVAPVVELRAATTPDRPRRRAPRAARGRSRRTAPAAAPSRGRARTARRRRPSRRGPAAPATNRRR